MPEASIEHVPQVIDTDYYNAGVFAPVLLPNRRTFAIVAAFTLSQHRTGWKALMQVRAGVPSLGPGPGHGPGRAAPAAELHGSRGCTARRNCSLAVAQRTP